MTTTEISAQYTTGLSQPHIAAAVAANLARGLASGRLRVIQAEALAG